MLHSLAQRCRDIAISKGFDVCTWENVPTKLMFVVSEIDETRDAMEAFSTSDIGDEFADIAIRTMVILETLWPDWSEGRILNRQPPRVRGAFEEPQVLLWPMLYYACRGLKHWRYEQPRDTQQCLELLLLELWRLADRLGYDMHACILHKMEINAGRPMLNGKKRSEG